MAANDGFERYYTEKIWALIPEIYKTEDGNQPRPDVLRKIVEVIGAQAAVSRRSIDRLWEDQHVETADDWAVPYIGDLVGTRPLPVTDPRARRVDVARTIFFRRRRGTPILLQTFVHELSGWDVVLVEAFRRLVRTFHRLDRVPVRVGRFTNTPQGGTADLRNPRSSELQPGPFDEYFHTVDVRRISGLQGWFNIRKLNFHLYRLEVFPIHNSDPYPLLDGDLETFTFDPSGRDIPLFSRGSVQDTNAAVGPVTTLDQNGNPFPLTLFDPRAQTSQCGPPDEWDVEKPIPCRLLGHAEYVVTIDAIAELMQLNPAPDSDTKAALELSVGIRFHSESKLREFLLDRGATIPSATPAWYVLMLALTLTDDSGKKNLYPASVSLVLQEGAAPAPVEEISSANLSVVGCQPVPANPVITTLIDPVLGRFARRRNAPPLPTLTLMQVPLPIMQRSGVPIPIDRVAVLGNASVDSSATPSIAIGDHAKVFGGVAMNTYGVIANAGPACVHLAVGARTGDIWSVGDVSLDAGAIVTGLVRTWGAISAQPGQITGPRRQNWRLLPSLTTIGAQMPEPPIASTSSRSTNYTMPPGAYGTYTQSENTLTLQPGVYYFERLFLTSPATLDIDPSMPVGSVFVYIRQQFTYWARTANFDAARIRFVVFEAGGAAIGGDGGDADTPARGTIVAMNGPIVLESERTLVGALFGRSVTVNANSNIVFVPFEAWESAS